MNKLKELRKSKNLLQKDIAKYLNIAVSTYSYWESGKYDIDNDNLKKLADYYNVSIDYLLGRNIDENNYPIFTAPNTVTIVGRGSGKKTVTLTDDEMKAFEAMLDAFNKNK